LITTKHLFATFDLLFDKSHKPNVGL